MLTKRIVEFSRTRAAFLLVCATAGAFTICLLAVVGGLRVTIPIANRAIKAELGNAYIVNIPPNLAVLPSDDQLARFQGPSELTEDGRQLGPGRTLHQNIREHGRGLFALNSYNLRFSTSDNSDPRKNGRHYQLGTAFLPSPLLLVALIPGIVLLIIRAMAPASEHSLPPTSTLKPNKVWAASAFLFGVILILLVIRGTETFSLHLTSPALMHLAIITLVVIPFVSTRVDRIFGRRRKGRPMSPREQV